MKSNVCCISVRGYRPRRRRDGAAYLYNGFNRFVTSRQFDLVFHQGKHLTTELTGPPNGTETTMRNSLRRLRSNTWLGCSGSRRPTPVGRAIVGATLLPTSKPR